MNIFYLIVFFKVCIFSYYIFIRLPWRLFIPFILKHTSLICKRNFWQAFPFLSDMMWPHCVGNMSGMVCILFWLVQFYVCDSTDSNKYKCREPNRQSRGVIFQKNGNLAYTQTWNCRHLGTPTLIILTASHIQFIHLHTYIRQ
jgi:hypothetical protein